MIVIYILLFVLATVGTVGFYNQTHHKSLDKSDKEVKPALSWVSKYIIKCYNHLPAESRTYGDIEPMLRALDIKHGGKDVVNKHFYDGYYQGDSGREFLYCDCACSASGFPFCNDYQSIFTELVELQNAVDEQAHALEVAKVQPDLDELERFKQALRAERGIITETTKEIR